MICSPVINHGKDTNKRMKDCDNHKQNKIDGMPRVEEAASISAKLRAAVLGLTPTAIFRYTFFSTVFIALAAGIIWHTATQSLHVNINKVDTTTLTLTGASDLGGIGSGEYKGVEWGVTNNLTSPAYVFVRIEMGTEGLYEITDLDGWVRVTAAENDNELIFAYGTAGAMEPVGIGEEVELSGRLHCLADAVTYSTLTGADMDIDVHGCLVYGTDNDGGEAVYNKSAGSLWQAYQDNK